MSVLIDLESFVEEIRMLPPHTQGRLFAQKMRNVLNLPHVDYTKTQGAIGILAGEQFTKRVAELSALAPPEICGGIFSVKYDEICCFFVVIFTPVTMH